MDELQPEVAVCGMGIILEKSRDAIEQKDARGIESAVSSFVDFAKNQAAIKPTMALAELATAIQFVSQGEWDQAENAYIRTFSLAGSEGNFAVMHLAVIDLFRLFDLQGRHTNALKAAQTAVKIAQKAGDDETLFLASRAVTRCLLDLHEPSAAIVAADELIEIASNKQHYIVQALILRASGYVMLDRLMKADADLAEVWPHISELSHVRLLAGIQRYLANWWETKGAVELARGDNAAATIAWNTAVGYRRAVSEAPQAAGPFSDVHLARSLENCARICRATGHHVEAENALRECIAIKTKWKIPYI